MKEMLPNVTNGGAPSKHSQAKSMMHRLTMYNYNANQAGVGPGSHKT